ncbi:MAG: DUF1345 domain-containing protein [Rhizomicrobium sp.]
MGVASYGLARLFGAPAPAAIGADMFFATFLVWSVWLVFMLTDADLARKADIEDVGAFIVTIMTLAAIAYTCFAIFAALNRKQHDTVLETCLTLAGAPLGWFMLQTVMAFRYANIYYRHDDAKGYVAPVDFPKCREPGPPEFVYLAMVIGMTAQVSDTNVQTTDMRNAITVHAVVSFFFNTVLIAMAVNAAISGGS